MILDDLGFVKKGDLFRPPRPVAHVFLAGRSDTHGHGALTESSSSHTQSAAK